MSFEILEPVDEAVIAHATLLSEQSVGKALKIHTKKGGFPETEGIQLAIIGVREDRNTVDNIGAGNNLNTIRKHLYQLFVGNWFASLADLGDLTQGNTVEDTYYALQDILVELIKKGTVPIIIGGGQDLTYANYRAYDKLEQTVNLALVDNRFDLGHLDEEISSESYLSKIIMDKPNNLFNCSIIGYQTFFNSQDKIALLDKLHFDMYRLGEITNNVKVVEPVMRDADIVSIDIGAIRRTEAPANNNAVPNGFYGEPICAISRYAGISDKVSSFGIYEYNAKYDEQEQTAQLMAQMSWYFIEGYNFRTNEYPCTSKKDSKK